MHLLAHVGILMLLIANTFVSSASAQTPVATPNPQATIAGTALSLIPMGSDGEVAIVALGEYRAFSSVKSLPYLVRNNTSDRLEGISVSAAVHDAAGKLIASGRQSGIAVPWQIGPGEIAFGEISFDDVDLPADATFDLTVQSDPARSGKSLLFVDLAIDELSVVDNRLVGAVRNDSNQTTGSLSSAIIACIDADGVPLGLVREGLNPDKLEPGQTATFQSVLRSGQSCPGYLVTAHGG